MRISDWSSDVCSSDLCALPTRKRFQCDLALFGAFRIVIGEFDVSADKDGRQSPFCAAFIGPARDLAAKADGEVRADQSEPPRSLVVSIFVNGDDDRDHQDECKDRKRDIGHMVHLVGRSAALDARWRRQTASRRMSRSEENTSEIQSLI